MSTSHEFPVLLNVNISESASSYIVRTDLSQFKVEHVDVGVWQDCLVIEMRTSWLATRGNRLSEIMPTCYRRLIPLGATIVDDDLTTDLLDGTLVIRINKTSVAARSLTLVMHKI